MVGKEDRKICQILWTIEIKSIVIKKEKITQKTLCLGSSEIRQGLKEQSKREIRSQENSQDAEREWNSDIPTWFFFDYGIQKALYRNKGLRSLVLLNIESVDQKYKHQIRNGNKRKTME